MDTKRYMVQFPPEIMEQLDRMKRQQFYNTSHSEMIRDLVARGIKAIEADHEEVRV